MEEQGALGGLASTQESSEVPIANLHLQLLQLHPSHSHHGHSNL